jgi:hypothetical protein
VWERIFRAAQDDRGIQPAPRSMHRGARRPSCSKHNAVMAVPVVFIQSAITSLLPNLYRSSYGWESWFSRSIGWGAAAVIRRAWADNGETTGRAEAGDNSIHWLATFSEDTGDTNAFLSPHA